MLKKLRVPIFFTTYEYDSAGNRVATVNTTTDNVPGSSPTTIRTEYLTDSQNQTSYSQVLQETEFDDTDSPTKKTVYAIGHDQISQTVYLRNTAGTDWEAGETHYFGTDGHGSVRVLYDAAAAAIRDAGNVAQIFHFDAYGNLLNFAAGVTPLTTYLYSGEAFDFNIGQQYLRARWYDPATGRFNRLDPYAGNSQDPQSFHKYAYVHSDPIQGIDPSGNMLASLAVRVAITGTMSAMLFGTPINIMAGRSGGFGALTGLAGGVALSKIYFYDRASFMPAALEALFGGAIAASAKYITDRLAGQQSTKSELASYAFEGVSWGAFYVAFIGNGIKKDLSPDSVESDIIYKMFAGAFEGGLANLAQLGAVSLAAATEIPFLLIRNFQLPEGHPERFQNTQMMRNSMEEFVGVLLGVLSGIVFDGAAALVDGPISRIYGIRGLPASTKAMVVDSIVSGLVGGPEQGIVDTIAESALAQDWRTPKD